MLWNLCDDARMAAALRRKKVSFKRSPPSPSGQLYHSPLPCEAGGDRDWGWGGGGGVAEQRPDLCELLGDLLR